MELNKVQKEAVETIKGPLLIIAGAGAGKTRVIVQRIAHIVESGVAPHRVLAVTFTNKAAIEMRERVLKLIGGQDPFEEAVPFVSTFHSLCVFIIKENARELGLTKWFSIYDRDNSKATLKKVMKELNIDSKQFEPGRVLSAISRNKGDLISVKEFAENAGKSYYKSLIARVWIRYDQILKESGALDFDDLLVRAVELLKSNEKIRSYYQNLWQYIHVDEYQDTNIVQYKLTKMLAEKHNNICVVGDMDQNIYSWRGANIRNILQFEKDFPNTKTVLLEENYRSTQTILSAANAVIKKNLLRKEKNLFTQNKTGEQIELYEAIDEHDEAAWIVEKAKRLIANKIPAKDISVLYRANFQSRVLEEEFLKAGVPHQVLGTSFYERREVKDTLAFIRAALNPTDWENMSRIINIPRRGMGEKTLELIRTGKEVELPLKMREKLASFKKMLGRLQEKLLTEPPSKAIKYVIKESGLEGYLEADPLAEDRLENIGELVTISKMYDRFGPGVGIEKMIVETALTSEQDNLKESKNGVRLMTVHASKGLEFEYVFIAGLEQGLFPHERSSETESGEDRAEEERRLFYVAVTRAKEKLHLSYTGTRMTFGERRVNIPSEFISDIPDGLVQIQEPVDPFEGRTNYLGNPIDY
ncbi:MAG TPA: UvrD-helicase domain-containing protein [Candidatus Paceibacterota bacterium]